MKNLESMYDIYVPERVFPRSLRIDNKITGETNATNMPSIVTNDKVSLDLGNGETFDGVVQDLLLILGYTTEDIDRYIEETNEFMRELDEQHNPKEVERGQIEITEEHSKAYDNWLNYFYQPLLDKCVDKDK